ncbi:Mitochondrial transcription termination factor family protein [Thalictrum thalictroides]|uniref:Mitochondrial transcription termination factor family protein n=1 Tax=Thalictrum thalictroides TaxID=46969 RepID=A0A7J6V0P7_THATH|nr:Mitochondrial transcription termination factor family protein [Thalictrum thalictroides]
MFGFLCSRVKNKLNKGLFCFNGESIKSLYFLQNPYHNRFISNNPTNQKSFTINYLINSCGLSEGKAISASKKVQLKNSVNPDSVLTLLKNYGFPKTYVSTIIEKHPTLLLSNADKILKPKLSFFCSLGISGPDLAKLLSWRPTTMRRSLGKHFLPAVNFLNGIVHTDDDLLRAITRSNFSVFHHPEKRLTPALKF